MRKCGDCQLCCKLLPVHDNLPNSTMHKGAGERCQHQRHHKGCMVYNTTKMPTCCKLWNCRWLVNDDAGDLSRPDHSHYVLDILPDYVTIVSEGQETNIQVVQIWVDPNYPDAHRDPALRRWLERREKQQILGLVRYNERSALCLLPPAWNTEGVWTEFPISKMHRQEQHSATEIARALGGNIKLTMENK